MHEPELSTGLLHLIQINQKNWPKTKAKRKIKKAKGKLIEFQRTRAWSKYNSINIIARIFQNIIEKSPKKISSNEKQKNNNVWLT